jgi:hypothetical protein
MPAHRVLVVRGCCVKCGLCRWSYVSVERPVSADLGGVASVATQLPAAGASGEAEASEVQAVFRLVDEAPDAV